MKQNHSSVKLKLAANECDEKDLWLAGGHNAAAQDARDRVYVTAERILADECPCAGTKDHSHLPRTLLQVRWAGGVSREYAETMKERTGVPYGWLGLALSEVKKPTCDHEWHHYGTVNGQPDYACQLCGATRE